MTEQVTDRLTNVQTDRRMDGRIVPPTYLPTYPSGLLINLIIYLWQGEVPLVDLGRLIRQVRHMDKEQFRTI